MCGTGHETTGESATRPEPAGTTRRAFLRAGAVAGLGVRDIFGFTAITCLITGLVFGGTLLLLGAG